MNSGALAQRGSRMAVVAATTAAATARRHHCGRVTFCIRPLLMPARSAWWPPHRTVATAAAEWECLPRAAVAVTLLRQRPGGRLQVLLAKRAKPPAAGSWSIPGGKIEPGEPALTAAAREVAEETGLAGPAVLRFHQHSVTCSEAIYPPDFHYLIAHYVALVSGRSVPVAGDDAAEIRWFSVQDL